MSRPTLVEAGEELLPLPEVVAHRVGSSGTEKCRWYARESFAFRHRIQLEVREGVLVRAVLVLRATGEVRAHRLRGLRRERAPERAVQLTDHTDLVLHEVGVVHVVHTRAGRASRRSTR